VGHDICTAIPATPPWSQHKRSGGPAIAHRASWSQQPKPTSVPPSSGIGPAGCWIPAHDGRSACGKRFVPAELAGLRWVDVDIDHATASLLIPRVVVDHQVQESAPKTERGRRRLALDPVTLAALRDHRKLQAEDREAVGRRYRDLGYVFTWPDGRPLHPDNIVHWFEQHSQAAGLPRIRLHDVRHSYATAALKAGISAKVISERLGHASVALTLQTYGHVIPWHGQGRGDNSGRPDPHQHAEGRAEDPIQVPSTDDQQPVEALSADGANPALGAGVRVGRCTGVSSTSAPSERNTSSKLRQNFASRSRSRKRTCRPRSSNAGKRLRAC
jgi:Phage integrase family